MFYIDMHVGVGAAGEIVMVKRRLFWAELQPSGAAVYPTEENIAEYRDAAKLPKYRRTPFALQVWGVFRYSHMM